jgi:hypothetical protein
VGGGRVAGPQVRFEPRLSRPDRLPGLIGGVAQRLYGLRLRQADVVFRSASPKDLQFI